MTLTAGQQTAILAILQNSRFIVDVAGSTKLARAYYNDYKYWCKIIPYKQIKGFENKNLKLVLHRNYSCNGMPTDEGSNINRILRYGPKNDEESIFYYYYKNHDFFVRILTALKWAIKSYNEGRYYCKVIELPKDFDWVDIGVPDNERVFTIESKDIMALYGYIWPIPPNFPPQYLGTIPQYPVTIQGVRGKKGYTWKLPKPKTLINANVCDITKRLPDAIGNYTFRNFVY